VTLALQTMINFVLDEAAPVSIIGFLRRGEVNVLLVYFVFLAAYFDASFHWDGREIGIPLALQFKLGWQIHRGLVDVRLHDLTGHAFEFPCLNHRRRVLRFEFFLILLLTPEKVHGLIFFRIFLTE
jgi:hypothetical protein